MPSNLPAPTPAADALPWHRRLATRIALGEAVSAGSLVVLAVLACIWLMYGTLDRAEMDHVRATAETLAASVEVVDGRPDTTHLARTLSRLAEDVPSLLAVRVRGAGGEALLDWSLPGKRVDESDAYRHSVRLTGPASSAALGSLEIVSSKAPMRELVGRLNAVVPTVVILALLLSLGAAYATGRRISRHIDEVTRAALRVARGDLGGEPLRVHTRDEVRELADAFNALTGHLRYLRDRAREIADGRLDVSIEGQGALAEVFRAMLQSMSDLVQQIRTTALQVNSASEEILATSSSQERGATEQSTAVEETRRTLESLLASGHRIADASQGVLDNAERTHRNNELVAERIGQLSVHTERIGEILGVIKDVANKSDLLALNAALEGTKAGEAGRGFSLVATQMQRLAENVMGAVRDIQSLTSDIQEATTASVLATEEGIKLASGATVSAREIGHIIQDQQSGIEQVTLAMNDVTKVAHSAVSANRDVTRAIEDLLELSRLLQKEVEAFQVGSEETEDSDSPIRSVA